MKDKVVIGNGGAELGVRGYVTAYDAATGEQVWRFYTVPGDPTQPFEHPELEMAAATWHGEWWEIGGGGTAWDAMAYDPELDLLYVGTGQRIALDALRPQPGWGRQPVPLRRSSRCGPTPENWPGTTRRLPGDNWDYTAVQGT